MIAETMNIGASDQTR